MADNQQPQADTEVVSSKIRSTRGRRTLLFLVLPISLIALGVATAGLVAYNQATQPDRSTPVISTDAFLHAVFVLEDAQRVALFVCMNWTADSAIQKARGLVASDARTSWDTFVVVSQNGDSALVQLRVRSQYPGEVAPSDEALWQVSLVEERGWRVCGLNRIAS